jgi:hypothetical protein
VRVDAAPPLIVCNSDEVNDSVRADDVARDDPRLADGILLQPLVAAGMVAARRCIALVGRGLQMAKAELGGSGLDGLGRLGCGLTGLSCGLGGLAGLSRRLRLLGRLLRGLRLHGLRGLHLDWLRGLRLLLGRCRRLALSAQPELLFDLAAAQRLVQLSAAQELDAKVGAGGEGLQRGRQGDWKGDGSQREAQKRRPQRMRQSNSTPRSVARSRLRHRPRVWCICRSKIKLVLVHLRPLTVALASACCSSGDRADALPPGPATGAVALPAAGAVALPSEQRAKRRKRK